MCGIAATLVAENALAVATLYEALLALQHRGQDAAGIVTEDAGRLCLHKDNGMVRDVFQQEHVAKLTGDMGIGKDGEQTDMYMPGCCTCDTPGGSFMTLMVSS